MLERWCRDFSPDTFLDQTAQTFAASLRGRAKAREAEADRALWAAWHTAAFSGAAAAGKLKTFAEYSKKNTHAGQTPQQMLGALRMLNDMGAPMTFKQVN